MMKNTEWGAVAYLSHSMYGIGREVSVNNNNTYLTGYGTAPGVLQNTYPGNYGTGQETGDKIVTSPYNTPAGYLASTTGNITGVYDMSGGAWEYMAAFRKNGTDQSKFPTTDDDNTLSLATYISKGYIDEYPDNIEVTTYQNRILGDATGEMGPFYNYKDSDNNPRYHNSWYADVSYFVATTYPWFDRGGIFYDGLLAGQFDFGRSTGGADHHLSSRLVLSPQK